MALTAQQQNLISEIQAWADTELAQLDKAQQIVARWNLNDTFNQIDDAEVTEIFAHLDKGKVTEAINAIGAVITALGDYVSGQAVNLIKMKG